MLAEVRDCLVVPKAICVSYFVPANSIRKLHIAHYEALLTNTYTLSAIQALHVVKHMHILSAMSTAYLMNCLIYPLLTSVMQCYK
jgi:hypothetical protein